MKILVDKDIRAAVRSNPKKLLEGMDVDLIESRIKGCSINLSIGEIYEPGVEESKPGSANKPRTLTYILKQGQTAVVKTKELFDLDAKHAAFVFPASAVSMQGLLMTNPGHVDPGYRGHLHVTVVNMGRQPFALVPGDRLLKAILIELDQDVQTPYANPTNGNPTINDELLAKLSPDFLDFQDRAKRAAETVVQLRLNSAQLLQFVIPALFALIASVATAYITNVSMVSDFEKRIESLENINSQGRLMKLENDLSTEKRFKVIEQKLDGLDKPSK